MKCLYFVLLVTVSHAYVPRVRRETDIPVPTITGLTAFDPPGFKVEWKTVTDGKDSADPVIGYKLKVWEQEKIKHYHYEIIDGVKVLVEEYVPVPFSTDPNKIPDGTPREIVIEGAEKNYGIVDHVKPGVAYESRLQAYTKTRDGPFSPPVRIEMQAEVKDHKRDMDHTMQKL